MNIETYTFEGHWRFIKNSKPPNTQRVLFTNGDTIVIGSLTIQDEVIHWLFDKNNMDGYEPIAWMELPTVNSVKKHVVSKDKTSV